MMQDDVKAQRRPGEGNIASSDQSAFEPSEEAFSASDSIAHLCDYLLFGKTQELEDILADLDELIREYKDDPEGPASSRGKKLL